ncbi:aspartyl protease family protein [Pedobacter insulae]|uniref:PDZ domain (Also known as DHR or GLGF) n=1 Tax=Pedobacter insulae TaxID=414048 RepID=A0A1I2XBW3_9SPHI|nr:aspartyl protease family protein [Pedobacter insulae]SFH10983.1 PDZ domain (Also known as DHR or GLGF) [Pedobacter insulae]
MKLTCSAIKLPFIVLFVITFAFQTGFVGFCYGQNFQFDYKIKRDALSFKLVKNLIIIPIYINDKGPFNFILDTGVDPLIITDSTIVDKNQLTNLRKVKINGTGEGDELTAYISNNINARVGAASMKHVPTVILKEDVFNLSIYLGLKIHGLIGYHFFNSFIVKINYTQAKVSFSLPQTRKKIKWNKLDLEFLENKPYINVPVKVPDLGEINAKLIIDCGASHALSLESYKEGVFPLPVPSFQANLGVGLGGKINGNIGRVTSIKLGEYELKNVLTSFPNYSDVAAKARQKQRTGNLGSDILKKFTVIFDYQGGAMYFKKNSSFAKPFEHDMSGVEIYVDDRQFNRVYVSRIEAASPAEKAGILADDEILSINFKKITDYSIDDVVNLLKSEHGKTILIEFSRNDKVYIKILALKRRL